MGFAQLVRCLGIAHRQPHASHGVDQIGHLGIVGETQKQGPIVLGELILMWTSVAPPSLSIFTIFFEVVPLTIESSTTITLLPSRRCLTGLSLIFTPKCLMLCLGSMNVLPT